VRLLRFIPVSVVLSGVVLAQAPTGPSDDPAPAEGTSATPAAKAPAAKPAKADDAKADDRPRGSQGFVEARGGGGELHFGGFDFGLTSFFSSGLYFAPEAYTGSLTFWLEPSWSFGRRFLKGTWFEPMLLAVRLPVELELAGNDGRFRSGEFATPSLFGGLPEEGLSQAPGFGLVDGPVRRPVILGDTWVNLIHGRLFTIPKVGISVASSLRWALPTSVASRNTGFVSSLSIGFIADKTFGPLHLTYVFRPAKYFYERTTSAIRGAQDTVVVNGRAESTWRPPSTGVANPDFGFINGLSASVELPKGFSVSASYFLFNVRPFANGPCVVPGVPQATCAEQPRFGGSNWRNDHWFLASLDWARGPVSLSLGLSTYRPITETNGTVSQPFLEVNRSNASTVYLSFSTSAEQLVEAFTEEKK
jgi:hypothetical protein